MLVWGVIGGDMKSQIIRQLKRICGRSYWIYGVLILLQITLFPQISLSFGPGTHTWIALQAFKVFTNDQLDLATIAEGSWRADEEEYVCVDSYCWWLTYDIYTPRNHFWDADHNSAFCYEGVCLDTAYEKASHYWNLAVIEYTEGRVSTAYKFLGHIAHLLSDMASPAHVHVDEHFLGDSIESHMESNYLRWQADIAEGAEHYDTLYGLMYDLNQRASWFPSDHVGGNDIDEKGAIHPEWHKGWPLSSGVEWPTIESSELGDSTKLDEISEVLMPLSIKYVAGLYKLFWEQFHLTITAPPYVTALNPNNESLVISGSGKINGNEPTVWEWDFAYDGSFNAEAAGQMVTIPAERYKYDSTNTKTIALRPNGDDSKIQTKQIFIRPYPISVSYPDGYESLHRHFSTPSSSLVDEYTWNYGDGSPTESGTSKGNSYPTSGYYTVTLTLTLHDGSSISSQQGIFVGPGKRYIQGHTIYGDETWHAGGTYVVQGNIKVAQGATLTIENGVEVQLNGGVQIDVYGTLTATGVIFTWADGVNAWNGIAFYNAGSSGSRLENCVIDHAKGYMSWNDANYWGPIFRISKSSPTIKGCTMQNCAPEGPFASWIPYFLIEGGSPILQGNTINGLPDYTAISIGSGATPTITQNTITGCQTGVNVGKTSFPGVTGNTFTGCQTGISIGANSGGTYQGNTLSNNTVGIRVDYSSNNSLVSGNTYSNNSFAGLYASGTITSAVEWNEGLLLYRSSNLTIGDTGSLVIPAGKTVNFDSGGQWNVYGILTATGVTFTWADGVNAWNGMAFYNAGSSGSRLENCVVEHAKGYMSSWDANIWSPIFRVSKSSPTIKGCTMQNCAPEGPFASWIPYFLIEGGSPILQGNTINGLPGYTGISIGSGASPTLTQNTVAGLQTGINITGGSLPVLTGNSFTGCQTGVNVDKTSFPGVTGNTFTSCETGMIIGGNSGGTYQGNTLSNNVVGIRVAYSSNNPLVSGNIYSNNSSAGLYTSGTITSAVEWNEGLLLYRSSNLTIGDTGSLVIPAGKTVNFDSGGQWNVYGILTATGVTFTWADGVNAWNGMAFYNAGSSGSRLENCVVEHAKGYMSSWDANIWSPIFRVSKSSPTIKGCTMQNCAPEGPFASWIPYFLIEGGSPILQGNTINGLPDYTAISIGSGATPTITQNTITGCQTGVNVGKTSFPGVTGNTFTGCQTGISIGANSGGTYQGNTLSNNTVGIRVDYSSNNSLVSGNTYSNNSFAGLYASGTITSAVEWNEGLLLYRSSNLTIGDTGSLVIPAGKL